MTIRFCTFFSRIFQWFFSALFPQRCIISRKEGTLLDKSFTSFPDPPKNKVSFSYIDTITAVTAYYHPVSERVLECLKFYGIVGLDAIIAESIVKKIPRNFFHGYTLIPIPLHWTRRWERGYNQSERIILALKDLIPEIHIDTQILKRIRRTQQQARLSQAERKKNIASAFELVTKNAPQRYILFDDVVASGSTLDSAASVLRAGGAKEVKALVWARGGKDKQ